MVQSSQNARRTSVYKSTLETGGAHNKQDEGNSAENSSVEGDSHRMLRHKSSNQDNMKRGSMVIEIDAINTILKDQLESDRRRIFSNPGRVLNLYKKSFNKSSQQFFQSRHSYAGADSSNAF